MHENDHVYDAEAAPARRKKSRRAKVRFGQLGALLQTHGEWGAAQIGF